MFSGLPPLHESSDRERKKPKIRRPVGEKKEGKKKKLKQKYKIIRDQHYGHRKFLISSLSSETSPSSIEEGEKMIGEVPGEEKGRDDWRSLLLRVSAGKLSCQTCCRWWAGGEGRAREGKGGLAERWTRRQVHRKTQRKHFPVSYFQLKPSAGFD